MAPLTRRFNPHGQGQRATLEEVFVQRTEIIHELLGRGLLLADDGLREAEKHSLKGRLSVDAA